MYLFIPTCLPLVAPPFAAGRGPHPRFNRTLGDALNQMDPPRGGHHVTQLTLAQAKGRLLKGRLSLTWWLPEDLWLVVYLPL